MFYFALLTSLGLGALFLYSHSGSLHEVLARVEPRYLLVALVLAGVDQWLGGWRNFIFVRRMLPGASPWLCIRANLANLFMGAMTPAQTGAAPAQLFVLYRGGIAVPQALAISALNYLSTLTFFLVGASLALLVVRDQFTQPTVRYLVTYAYVIFSGLVVLLGWALWQPHRVLRFLPILVKGLGRLRPAWGARLERVSARLEKELLTFRDTCITFMRREPLLLLYSLATTATLYLNKFIMAYFLMRGLGVEGDFVTTLALQMLLVFTLYFAPTPGASGIAEVSTGALMSVLMPLPTLPLFTLLQRMLLVFIPAAAGSVVVLRLLHSAPPAPTPPTGGEANTGGTDPQSPPQG
jgi:uncharacterized protein (TIRG00374 family)